MLISQEYKIEHPTACKEMNPTRDCMSLSARHIQTRGGNTNRRAMLCGRLSMLLLAAWVVGDATCLSLGKTNVHVVESERDNSMSRRSCLTKVVGGLSIFATGAATGGKSSFAEEFPSPSSEEFKTSRTKLIQLIRDPASSSNEAKVLAAIEELVPFDPSQKRGASLVEDLDGEWELLWSAKAEAFSPLLKLPKPFKPDSFQYLGSAAAGEVGPDRVAQGLTGGILGPNQLWLSSGVRTSSSDASILEILPPFRFEVGGRYQTGGPKKRLVEAGSDADFRKLNARTSEAQAAPKNSYQQLYLEREGKGSLRISTITDGDPVIVGAIFVHRKL